MYFSTLLMAITLHVAFLATTSALALPSWPSLSSPKLRLHKRGLPGAVYICTDKNFEGACGWVMPSNECHIAGTGSQAPESIGPDPGGFCALYDNAKCTGNQIQVLRFPGVGAGLPPFQGIKCLPDGPAKSSGNSASIRLKTADPRLAGGEGSLKAKTLKDILGEMDKSEGVIGQEKDVYY